MHVFWRMIGVGLLLWAAWDIYFGYTILYDVIYKEQAANIVLGNRYRLDNLRTELFLFKKRMN